MADELRSEFAIRFTRTEVSVLCAWSIRLREDEGCYQGANYGWQKMVGGLERVAGGWRDRISLRHARVSSELNRAMHVRHSAAVRQASLATAGMRKPDRQTGYR